MDQAKIDKYVRKLSRETDPEKVRQYQRRLEFYVYATGTPACS